MAQRELLEAETIRQTDMGEIVHGESVNVLAAYSDDAVDLIMTSPPFGLVRKKDYGNVDADEYVDWFKPFAKAFHRVLKNSGSLVIDIGGAWNKGYPTRNLYHFKLLIMLCEEFGFHLAQEFYWWNPSRLPTPAEWVTVRRVRVKDAVNTVWWLSKTPWPKAGNRRVLQPYSASMQELLTKGYRAKRRPSGHEISAKFNVNNGAAIPPNLIAIPNTESNSFYLRYCEENGFKPHPARYPAELPEYFIRMLTEPGDLVVDPFAGSCVTGEVCERTERRWVCIELVRDYCAAALGRFVRDPRASAKAVADPDSPSNYYRLARPGILWQARDGAPLVADGGRKRGPTPQNAPPAALPASERQLMLRAESGEIMERRPSLIPGWLVGRWRSEDGPSLDVEQHRLTLYAAEPAASQAIFDCRLDYRAPSVREQRWDSSYRIDNGRSLHATVLSSDRIRVILDDHEWEMTRQVSSPV